jgi:hypothetical protein
MFGDQWIETITQRETWLIERYVEGRGAQGASSIISSRIVWEVAGRRWVEYPSDPALVAEVERARDRRDWRQHQWSRAFDWLGDHSFDLDAADIDQGALEAAMLALRREITPGAEPPDDERSAAPAPDFSTSGRKRQAVDAGIKAIGLDALRNLPLKVREPKIKELAESQLGGLTVTEHYTRERLAFWINREERS